MWRPLSFAAKSPLSLEMLCASLPTSSSTVNKTSSVLIVEITVRLKRSRHPSLICEPQTDQRARPSLQVTLWQVPRCCWGEAHAHMSCYMAVKPRHRAQTPVGIQPTASTHQLCRRKIQIVSSIQTGGNKPPVLITSSHNFFFYHLSDNQSLFMQNVCQNILSTMIPNRTVQKLFSVKRLKKRKKEKQQHNNQLPVIGGK